MKLLFLLPLVLVSSFDLPSDKCDTGVKIDDVSYNLTKIHDVGDANPTETHFDVYGNLFYILIRRNDDEIRYDAFKMDNNTNDPEKIEGLPQGETYSIAVDRTYSEVYFGTGKGIFRYDYEHSNATRDSTSSLQLNMIFVDKDGNKFITENSNGIEELYILDGEKKIKYNAIEALNELMIDDDNNFYYIKQDQLFQLKCDALTSNYICDLAYNGVAQIALYDEKVFVASQSLSYFHENQLNKLKSVENIPGNVTTVAFDNTGDFILGTDGKLLKYEKNDNCYNRQ